MHTSMGNRAKKKRLKVGQVLVTSTVASSMKGATRVPALKVSFTDSNGLAHEIPPNWLIVMLDETGHEDVEANSAKFFGLAGCAVPAKLFHQVVGAPWIAMKIEHFGGEGTRMHAAKMRPSETQKNALGNFFRTNQFARIACLATTLTTKQSPLPLHEIVERGLLTCISDVATNWRLEGVAYVFEHSERYTPQMAKHLGPQYELVQVHEGHQTRLPSKWFIMPKAIGWAGLEVADFIAQPAGAQIRDRMQDSTAPLRQDFQLVFDSVERRLSSCWVARNVKGEGDDATVHWDRPT